MNLIQFPLRHNSKSSDIKNLHYVLFFLKQQLDNIAVNKLFDEQDFMVSYTKEVFNQQFGKSTAKLIFVFQDVLHIENRKDNVIDEFTAAKFNELLRQFGGLQIEKPDGYPFEVKEEKEEKKKYVISGRVVAADNKSDGEITVIALNKNLRSERELGRAQTPTHAFFTISYEPVFARSEYKTADVIFKLYKGRVEIKDFTVALVTNKTKTALTDGILFNAGERAEVEIRLPEEGSNGSLSVFEQITQLVSPLLEGVKIEELNENEKHKDFSFLSGETGLDKGAVSRFALAHRLLAQSGIEAEFWFALTSGGFYRELAKSFTDQNLDTNLPKTIEALYGVNATSIKGILEEAFEADLIPAKLKAFLPKWMEGYSAFIIKRIANAAGEEQTPYVKSLMDSVRLPNEKQQTLLRIYLSHGAFNEALWKELEANKAFGEKEINKLQFAHSLTSLAGNNEKLVGLAAALPRINNMRELALKHNATSLAQVITPAMLPDNAEGETTKEKIKNYASALQQQLFHTQTSAVLQRMATDNELPIKDDKVSKGVASFLNNQPDFNIRTTSIYNAIKTENAFNGIAVKHQEEVTNHLKTLQRVQAISPDNETVATMMKANIKTAHQVTELSEAGFVQAFSTKMGGEVARQIYTNATNLKLRNEHALVSIKEAMQGSGVAFIDGDNSAADRKAAFAAKAAEKGIPLSWENLFGNIDFCECGECTSVYSPAAYFVELLQYLRNNDLDPAQSGVQAIKPDPKDISGTVLEKLFRRRPDLGCLELTCANTNTVLPYVDLVIEVMESFVVHLNAYSKNTLTPKQATIDAWNVEDETSGELLAQPQHINKDAYLELKKAVYPFSLPYDRPVDMLRIFLQYLETSRYELMKTFRSVEQATISKEVMPESAVLPVAPSPDPDQAKIPAFNKILTDRAIDAEFLCITQEEYVVLTKEAFLTKDYFNLRTPGITDGQYRAQVGVLSVPEYYGYTSATGKADMLSTDETPQVGLTFVKKQFLKRTGLLYTDLVELLKTETLNPVYPKGKALVILESIPFSYRFLQGLVNLSLDPEVRFKKLIDALENPQNYIPGYDERINFNPCKREEKTRPAFRSANIKQWVYCYFERIGQMIVLENNSPGCDCVEGQFFRRDGTDIIQLVDTEGRLSLTKNCDLMLTRTNFSAKVGHVDSMTGFVSLTDKNGRPIDVSVLTRQDVVFKGKNGEDGLIASERLINHRTERPFGCKQSLTDNCDLDLVRLKHLDGTDLRVTEYDKMHRFIRLWRKMGWTIDETDKALVALTADKTTFTRGFKDSCEPEVDPKGFAEITPDLLHQLVAVKKLVDSTGLELIKLLAFWTDISTSGKKSLYQRLFLSHNLLAIDAVFKADANGNYLTTPEKIADHIPVLMAAFKVKYEEVDALVSASDPLTLQTVSNVFRHTLLAKVLHVKTADLKDAIALFGDPFKNADEALSFFDKWNRMESAGFTFTQLDYVVQDIDSLARPVRPSRNSIISLAKTIYDGLVAIDAAHPDLPVMDELAIQKLKKLKPNPKKEFLERKATEEATEELVRTKVSLLFDSKNVDFITGLLQGTNVYSAVSTKALVKNADEFASKFLKKFPHATEAEKHKAALLLKRVKYDFATGALQVTGMLNPQDKVLLKGLFNKTEWHKAVDDVHQQEEDIFTDLLNDIFKNHPAASQKILQEDKNDPDNDASNTAPEKRKVFLERFLPFLREKLTEKFLVETLSGATGLEGDAARVLMGEILESSSAKKIIQLFEDAKQLPAAGSTGWKGYLVPVADELYTLTIKTTKTFSVQIDGETILLKPVKGVLSSEVIKLKAGQFYLFEVTGLSSNLEEISWSTTTSPKAPIPTQVLLPISAVQDVEEGFIKLFKAAILVNGFSLTADEISLLHDHATDFDNLDFNAISLTHLLRIEAYSRLRQQLPASNLTLADFFKWAHTGTSTTSLGEQIALLTARKKEDIDVLLAPQHFNWGTPADFFNEINLLKLLDAFLVYDKINMKPDLLFQWAAPVSQFNVCQVIADTIRKSIQARYKQEDWERVVKPLNDQLREHQKQALINYLLVQQDLISWDVTDADGLFEFFLIDVQMDACMQTSRMKQAISSVQLFIQRCFLGQEASRGVPNNILDRNRWNWMQRNPIWVANRKVFLWPENWTLTNLRDDKSPFFKELESDLLQKDVNKQNVTDALKSYLYKVDEVANMEVIGLYIETKADVPLKLHVFARTRNAPYFFYYRFFDAKEGNWYAWEKMQVDIPTYDVSTLSLTINVNFAQFAADGSNTVTFNGEIQSGYEAPVKNFKGRFGVSPTLDKTEFELDENGDHILRYVEFDVDNLNGVAAGSIRNIHVAANISFAGIFEGELRRKNNTNGCYLVPAVWNGRLLVFFPQIMKKTKPVDNVNMQGPVSKPAEYYEIKMAWSEYRNGKWTQKQMSKDVLNTHPRYGLIQIEYFKFVPVVTNASVVIDVDDRLDADAGYLGAFEFDGNGIHLSGGAATDNMPINYFNKVEISDKEAGSKIFSWQISNNKRTNTSIYFENAASKEMVRGVANASTFFHPYTHDLQGRINTEPLQTFFEYNLSIADKADAFGIDPVTNYHELKRPYSLYNWEVFFHTPIAIAQELSAANQFEEAMKWYHYVFKPTAMGTDPKRFWQFQPFKETNADHFLESFFNGLQPNTPDQKIDEWRTNPFQPHMIARSRPTAYMKWVVMGYIENLIAWGDYLFKQDTIETVNYATQLYVLAGHILGPRPQLIPKRGKIKPETYNSLLDKWDVFGNAMVEMELLAPFSSQTALPVGTTGGNGDVATANIFGFASSLYFCIPNNPKLIGYWDTLADRLYKIRHCENIEGVFRMLPLWDPPIDPALLVAATAQGLSLDSVLNDLNTALPNYRFVYLLQKAIELCNEVKSLGNSLLSVLEKKDGEALARMRAGYETTMNNMVMEVKKLQLDEATKALEGFEQNRRTTEYKLRHYLQLVGEDVNKVPLEDSSFSEIANQLPTPIDESGLKLIKEEKEEMDKAAEALGWQLASNGVEALSGILHALPDAIAGLVVGYIKEGGSHFGHAASAASKVLQMVSSVYSYESSSAQRKAGFRRQLQDRIMQANLAGYECMQIDKQITSQRIRISVSNQEISNQQKMIDNSAEAEEFLKNKYTNEELFKWMEGQVKTLYRQVYNLAYDWAKKADLVFRFERGLTSSNFIQYGYWDSSRDGLQAGEKLFLGLKQMEAAYNENRGHDFEVVKHISLQQLDPIALIELRETGKCEFSIPETLFDLDFPGHYMRRIKSVALSIPCIAGPYTSINATLRLQEHTFRVSSIATSNTDYLRKTDEEDARFTTAHVPVAAIATSSGQHDSGVFELNFKDERYMPFEGAGAISKWRLELPDFSQFNYETISDIIVHLNYTSKDGGNKLQAVATGALRLYMSSVEELSQREGLFALFDIKHDFPNEWYKALVLPPSTGGRVMELGNLSERLPFYTRNPKAKSIKAEDVYFVSDHTLNFKDLKLMIDKVFLTAPAQGPEKLNNNTSLQHLGDLGGKPLTGSWSLTFDDKVKEPAKMWMVVRYSLT